MFGAGGRHRSNVRVVPSLWCWFGQISVDETVAGIVGSDGVHWVQVSKAQTHCLPCRINLRSIEWVANISVVLVVLAIIPLMALSILCIPYAEPSVWGRERPTSQVQFGPFLAIALWNFSG